MRRLYLTLFRDSLAAIHVELSLPISGSKRPHSATSDDLALRPPKWWPRRDLLYSSSIKSLARVWTLPLELYIYIARGLVLPCNHLRTALAHFSPIYHTLPSTTHSHLPLTSISHLSHLPLTSIYHLSHLPSPISHLSPSTPLPSINPLRRWKYLPGMWYCWRTRNCIKHLTVVWAIGPIAYSGGGHVQGGEAKWWRWWQASFFNDKLKLPFLFYLSFFLFYVILFTTGESSVCHKHQKKMNELGPGAKGPWGLLGGTPARKTKTKKKNKVLTCTILTSKYGNHTLKSKWYM